MRNLYNYTIYTSDGYCRPEIMRRIGLASAVMSSLRSVWNNRQLCVDTKVHVYHALVQSVLLYGSETWTLLVSDIKKLEAFHLRCQRQLLRVSWRDHITNEAICKQTKLTSLTELISRRRSLHHYLVISLDLTQLSLHIKPCGCRRTFPQEGIRVQAGRDCQVVPGKHGPLRFQMILECHRALRLLGCLHSLWPWKRDTTVFENYALMMTMMMQFAIRLLIQTLRRCVQTIYSDNDDDRFEGHAQNRSRVPLTSALPSRNEHPNTVSRAKTMQDM